MLLLLYVAFALAQWSQLSQNGPALLTTDPNAMPDATSLAPMWCVNSDVYVLTTHLWKFETTTSRWLWQPDSFIPLRTSAAYWTMRNILYLYGGLDANGTVLSDMWSYNPLTRVPTYIGSYLPVSGAAFWIHSQSNRLYVWGGGVQLRAFDVTTNQWSDVAYTGGGPAQTAYGSATIAGNVAYVYNGDKLWSLDLSTFVWKQSMVGITAPPGPSRIYSTLWASPNVMLYGGSAGSQIYSDTWSYASNQWNLLTNNVGPSPRQRFSTCVNVNNSLVLFGGDLSNDLWMYGPKTDLTLLQKLEVGLQSAVLWSFASAILSALLLLCFTLLGIFLCLKSCRNRRNAGMSSTVKLAGRSDDFAQL